MLINALSTHMMHNLNTIFYTYIEHTPAKTFTYYMETHTRMRARTHTHTHTHTMAVAETDWVFILVGVEIL